VLRELLHRLARFRFGRDPLLAYHRDAAGLGHRDPSSGAEEARGAGDGLATHGEQIIIVGAHADGGADAPVGALLQVADQPVAGRTQMHVGVDQGGHHGLAGKVHALGASRDFDILGVADLHDPRAVDDDGAALDDAAVAHDQPRTFERRDCALRAGRDLKPHEQTKGHGCRDGGQICSAIHWKPPHVFWLDRATVPGLAKRWEPGSSFSVRRDFWAISPEIEHIAWPFRS